MPTNERITEELIRSRLRELGYYKAASPVVVEEQKSQIADIAKLLASASKSGKGGPGSPEFIITSSETPDFLIVVECKGSPLFHESPNRDHPKDYAVDGALHYARALSKSYNVIAVAASGQTEAELKISAFLWPQKGSAPRTLTNQYGQPIAEIIPFGEFIRAGEFDPEVERNRYDDLMAFSRELHDFMRDHAKLTESEKPLLVSGTLIALRNRPFAVGYQHYKPEELQRNWQRVIQEEFEAAQIPHSKTLNMTQPYSSIAVHPELGKATKSYPRGVLHELIKRLAEKVWPFISVYHAFDIVGQFYGEFLKYTGGDKKSLGIVLTPRHVTELFALLANVNKDDRVIDPCAGTGGFLIASMRRMLESAQTEAEQVKIKNENLIGIEQQPNMYALAASNMILRGDGKANLYQGSCFDEGIVSAAKAHGANIGMINPPYSQGSLDLHELVFVKNMLDLLTPGGTGIAIVPVSCATKQSVHKDNILRSHTLEAVMSMPMELFYPVGTVTCIMVFRAGVPHAVSNKKTWFGLWHDDGFIKTKHLGRVDLDRNWPRIRDQWVSDYRNREVHPGRSVTQQVGPMDEWVAEAYMETDYSTISEELFEKALRDYAVFRLSTRGEINDESE